LAKLAVVFSVLLLVPVGAQNVFAGPGVADLDFTIDSTVFDSNTNTITIQATIVHNGGDIVGPASVGFLAFPRFTLIFQPATQPFQWDSCTIDEPGLICEAPVSGFFNFASTGVNFNDFDGFSSGESFTFTATGSLTGQANSIGFGATLSDPSGSTTDPDDNLNLQRFSVNIQVPSPQICGDGTLDVGEECDNGNLNSDLAPDACRTDCKLPSCGDSTIDSFEQCDDGNNNFAGGFCSTQCIAAFCGDGIIFDATSGGTEQCDDGNAADGDGCSSSCVVETGAGFDCGPKTEPVGGFCVPKLDDICSTGTIIEPTQMLTCIAQAASSIIGGALLEINSVSLLVGSIGVNPIITGLVGITIAGVAGQAVWFVHRRKKSENLNSK